MPDKALAPHHGMKQTHQVDTYADAQAYRAYREESCSLFALADTLGRIKALAPPQHVNKAHRVNTYPMRRISGLQGKPRLLALALNTTCKPDIKAFYATSNRLTQTTFNHTF